MRDGRSRERGPDGRPGAGVVNRSEDHAFVRVALASLDDLRAYAREFYPEVSAVLLSWSARTETATVMGVLGGDGRPARAAPEALHELTERIAHLVPARALRLAYPGFEQTGVALLTVPVDEPEWARIGDAAVRLVDEGLFVPDDEIRDALWLLLDAAGLPAGAVRVRRLVLAPEVSGDSVFTPVELCECADGSGQRVPWSKARVALPSKPWARAVAVLASELAERVERAEYPVLLTDVLVPI